MKLSEKLKVLEAFSKESGGKKNEKIGEYLRVIKALAKSKRTDEAEKIADKLAATFAIEMKKAGGVPKPKKATNASKTPKPPKKTKAAVTATHYKAIKTDKKRITDIAAEIRKEGESWREAMKRAGEQMRNAKKTAQINIADEVTALKKMIEEDPIFAGFPKGAATNLDRDRTRTAKKAGKRISKSGKVYYEKRENRTDRKVGQPDYTKGRLLEKGGVLSTEHRGATKMADGGHVNTATKDSDDGKWVVYVGSEVNPTVLGWVNTKSTAVRELNKLENESKYENIGIADMAGFKRQFPNKKIEPYAASAKKTTSPVSLADDMREYARLNGAEEKEITLRIYDKDVDAFRKAGATPNLIRAFYLGVRGATWQINSDLEVGDLSGIFSTRDDYVRKQIERALALVRKSRFEVGFKYPDFKKEGTFMTKTAQTMEVNSSKRPWPTPDYPKMVKWETFWVEKYAVDNSIVFVGAVVSMSSQQTSKSKPVVIRERQVVGGKLLVDGLNSGNYIGLVTDSAEVAEMILASLLKQNDTYCKNIEVLLNGLGGIGSEDLAERFKTSPPPTPPARKRGRPRKNAPAIPAAQKKMGRLGWSFPAGKYIATADIGTVTVNNDGREITFQGKDVLSGVYQKNYTKFEKGGRLTNKANYFPSYKVVDVKLKDGKKVSANAMLNGFWVEKSALPKVEGAEEEVDLFEYYDDQPKAVQDVLANFDLDEGQLDFDDQKRMLEQMEKIGYTFELDMSGTPYGLQKKSSKVTLAKGGTLKELKKRPNRRITKGFIYDKIGANENEEIYRATEYVTNNTYTVLKKKNKRPLAAQVADKNGKAKTVYAGNWSEMARKLKAAAAPVQQFEDGGQVVDGFRMVVVKGDWNAAGDRDSSISNTIDFEKQNIAS